jgi:hypothetical protein
MAPNVVSKVKEEIKKLLKACFKQIAWYVELFFNIFPFY